MPISTDYVVWSFFKLQFTNTILLITHGGIFTHFNVQCTHTIQSKNYVWRFFQMVTKQTGAPVGVT